MRLLNHHHHKLKFSCACFVNPSCKYFTKYKSIKPDREIESYASPCRVIASHCDACVFVNPSCNYFTKYKASIDRATHRCHRMRIFVNPSLCSPNEDLGTSKTRSMGRFGSTFEALLAQIEYSKGLPKRPIERVFDGPRSSFGSHKIMPPKRRVWKGLQKMKHAPSRAVSMV